MTSERGYEADQLDKKDLLLIKGAVQYVANLLDIFDFYLDMKKY
ncbi:helix-turn-helix domain-containing protein [Brevibacillus sp. MS2.2]|nr:helix-turn-helix domain-containing protein [Brevibacillus sp. MS2.2]